MTSFFDQSTTGESGVSEYCRDDGGNAEEVL